MDKRTFLAALLALGLSTSGATAQAPRRPAAAPAETVLARRQIAAGDLTQALATLERATLARPANGEARLLHASVLCRLDDPEGSLVEFDQLRGWDFAPELWREATAPCEAARQ
jgi:Flp pilus assembly protein TadD